jgi:hypothetical protein
MLLIGTAGECQITVLEIVVETRKNMAVDRICESRSNATIAALVTSAQVAKARPTRLRPGLLSANLTVLFCGEMTK